MIAKITSIAALYRVHLEASKKSHGNTAPQGGQSITLTCILWANFSLKNTNSNFACRHTDQVSVFCYNCVTPHSRLDRRIKEHQWTKPAYLHRGRSRGLLLVLAAYVECVDTNRDLWLSLLDARPGDGDLPPFPRATSRRQRSKFSMKLLPTNQSHCGGLGRRWLVAVEKPEAPSRWRQRRRSKGWRGFGTRMAGPSGNKLCEVSFVTMKHARIPQRNTSITQHLNKPVNNTPVYQHKNSPLNMFHRDIMPKFPWDKVWKNNYKLRQIKLNSGVRGGTFFLGYDIVTFNRPKHATATRSF